MRLVLTVLLLALVMTLGPEMNVSVGRAFQLSGANLQSTQIRFAVIGDYGLTGTPESDVADQVKSWQPDFIVTVGDNNYPNGADATIDGNIGQYYHDFISPYSSPYGAGAAVNSFFPVLGNHDWVTPNAQPYLDYFSLPGNERYYDFTQGPVHFFMLDSDPHEPDGNTATSTQAAWLQAALAASSSPWDLVLMHHPPYSSGGTHGSTASSQWPYQAWGADAVLAGHDHDYERILRYGFPYFVDGLGGVSKYNFGTPVAGSQVRYNGDYGALLVDATSSDIVFQFITRGGILQDTFQLPFMLISGNAGVGGAALGYTDGTANTIIADGSGNYTLPVSHGWSGTVTPSKAGYYFAPASRTYTNVSADQTAQNYAAFPFVRPHPSDGAQACMRPSVGVDLILTDFTRNSAGSFDPSTVKLLLDGNDVTNFATVLVNLTFPSSHATILYTPTMDLAIGPPHTAAFTYATGSGPTVFSWSFNVASTCTSTLQGLAATDAPDSRLIPLDLPTTSPVLVEAAAETSTETPAPSVTPSLTSVPLRTLAPVAREDEYRLVMHRPR